MKPNDCEQLLKQLGDDWPDDNSFTNEIMERLEQDSVQLSKVLPASNKGFSMMRLSFASLVALILVVGLISILPSGRDSVSAKTTTHSILNAVMNQDSIYIHSTWKDESGLEKKMESWLVKGKGYVELIEGKRISVDDGVYNWQFQEGTNIAHRTASRNYDDRFKSKLQLPDDEYERLEKEDITENDEKLFCYAIKNAAPYSTGPQRAYLYIDVDNRIRRVRSWVFKNQQWDLIRSVNYKYNIAVDERLLKPDFDDSVEIIDLDAMVNKLVGLEDALFHSAVLDFEYAVHRAQMLKNGGLSLLVSVRKSNKAKSSNTSANIYNASPQYHDGFRLKLAELKHGGIDVQWFIYVPRAQQQFGKVSADGKFKLEDTVSTFDRSVSPPAFNHQFKSMQMEIPVENIEDPLTLKEAAEQVYRDHQQLEAIEFKLLDMGVYFKDGQAFGHSGSIKSTSIEKYADAVVNHLRHWETMDEKSIASRMEKEIVNGRASIQVPAISVTGIQSFDDQQLARAVKRQDLVVIRAGRTNVTDKGMALLKPLNQLEELLINQTQVGDEGLSHIQTIRSLKELDVRESNVTKEGIQRLRSALPKLRIQSDFD